MVLRRRMFSHPSILLDDGLCYGDDVESTTFGRHIISRFAFDSASQSRVSKVLDLILRPKQLTLYFSEFSAQLVICKLAAPY